jgi:hypothetical protein
MTRLAERIGKSEVRRWMAFLRSYRDFDGGGKVSTVICR